MRRHNSVWRVAETGLIQMQHMSTRPCSVSQHHSESVLRPHVIWPRCGHIGGLGIISQTCLAYGTTIATRRGLRSSLNCFFIDAFNFLVWLVCSTAQIASRISIRTRVPIGVLLGGAWNRLSLLHMFIAGM